MGFNTSSATQVKYPKLDIADKESIRSLVETIKKDHETVDALINNAGVNVDDDYSPQNVKVTLDTNVRGTLQVRTLFYCNLFANGLSLLVPVCRWSFTTLRNRQQYELPDLLL